MGYVLLCPIAESVPRASRNVNLLEEVEAQKLAAGDFDDYSPPPHCRVRAAARLPHVVVDGVARIPRQVSTLRY